MKTHHDIKHEGTLDDADRRRMTFDENSIAHLMSVLTDLYSDPETAVIREYATNAWDSHQEAGISDPIEVVLPTALSPSFVIRDHGVGMSEDEIYNNFSKYGFSSKRETDDQVGMLGLGCKSGLTLTSQFTLICTKAGEKITVLITREGDGAGAVQVIDKKTTDDPNGVEVQIPIGSGRPGFSQKAHDFFKFWEPGQVLINGVAPKFIQDDKEQFLKIDDDVFLTKELQHDYVIMGNVAYPIKDDNLAASYAANTGGARYVNGRYVQRRPKRGVSYYWHIVARVPIGAVNFTPSREELHYTKRTKEVAETIYDFVSKRVEWFAQRDIDAAKNAPEAFKRAQNWESILGGGAFSYEGLDVPSNGQLLLGEDNKTYRWSFSSFGSRDEWLSHPSERVHTFAPSMQLRGTKNVLCVSGVNGRGVTRPLKASLLAYCNAKNINQAACYISQKSWFDPWLNGEVTRVSLKELEKYKPAAAPRGKAAPIKFRLLTADGAEKSDPSYDFSGKTVLWTPPIRSQGYGNDYTTMMTGLQAVVGDKLGTSKDSKIVTVLLRKREVEPFLKKHKNAIEFKLYFAAAMYDWASKTTPTQVHEIKNGNIRSGFGQLPPERVLDEELRSMLLALKDNSKTVNEWRRIERAAQALRIAPAKLPNPQDVSSKLNKLANRYPIISRNSYYGDDVGAALEYVNALYVARRIKLPVL